ncbi:hypothetical protein, partial [Paludisphaera soli]|uniref:hypothetical protein n=1 Tax=Paludisphaera soli TaxID=2712865 RepID=UPI00197DD455
MRPPGPDARARRALFWGRPTLVGVEPASLTALFCGDEPDRKAATWARRLGPFDRLEFVVSDAASGIASAVARLAEARRGDPDARPLEHGLDLFLTTMEARRVLARRWGGAEAAWERAEAADAAVAASRRRGVDARAPAATARAAWRRATTAFGEVDRLEAAWARAHAALDAFTPDGRLNDRGRAEAEIAAALGDLAGPEWSKVRNFLGDRRGLAFLDRMHRRLAVAEPDRERREAMAWRWRLGRRRPRPADPATALIRAVALARRLDGEERTSSDRVEAVLRDTHRAGSAVEGMNSVLRMHQSRHRRMTRPMLDLKRLYW